MWSSSPVIVSSGYNESEAVSRFGVRAAAFLQKPYRAEELGRKVKSALS